MWLAVLWLNETNVFMLKWPKHFISICTQLSVKEAPVCFFWGPFCFVWSQNPSHSFLLVCNTTWLKGLRGDSQGLVTKISPFVVDSHPSSVNCCQQRFAVLLWFRKDSAEFTGIISSERLVSQWLPAYVCVCVCVSWFQYDCICEWLTHTHTHCWQLMYDFHCLVICYLLTEKRICHLSVAAD